MRVNNVTTVSGMTRNVENISHKPRRFQHQIEEDIKAEKELYGESAADEEPRTIETPLNYTGAVPKFITKEKAIHYFEQNAKGEVAELYIKTAMWLRQSLSNKKDYQEVLKAVHSKDLSSSNVEDLAEEEGTV